MEALVFWRPWSDPSVIPIHIINSQIDRLDCPAIPTQRNVCGRGKGAHVIPGFLGTPAGITTISAPFSAPARLSHNGQSSLESLKKYALGRLVALYVGVGVDMAYIGSYTGSSTDIV